MNNTIPNPFKLDTEAIESCEIGTLRDLIAQNSKKIDEHLKSLEELKQRIIGDKPQKAII